MPAVDYRLDDGLSWDELVTVLRIALRSGKAVGLEIALYKIRSSIATVPRGVGWSLRSSALGHAPPPPRGTS